MMIFKRLITIAGETGEVGRRERTGGKTVSQ